MARVPDADPPLLALLAQWGVPGIPATARAIDCVPDAARESAAFDALCQADVVRLDGAGLQQLFDWYAHVSPDACALGAPHGCGAALDACVALMANFSLLGMVVLCGGCAVYVGADGTVLRDGLRPQPAP